MKMSPEQKMQVAVARDVLKWITPSKVKSANGYVMNSKEGSSSLLDGKDSKKVAKLLQKKCEVCAKGALLLALVGMKNDFDFFDSNYKVDSDIGEVCGTEINIDYTDMMVRLEEVFDLDQLNLIEIAFEATDGPDYRVEGDFGYDAAVFGGKYKKDITRLRAIMDNIIENKGEFRP